MPEPIRPTDFRNAAGRTAALSCIVLILAGCAGLQPREEWTPPVYDPSTYDSTYVTTVDTLEATDWADTTAQEIPQPAVAEEPPPTTELSDSSLVSIENREEASRLSKESIARILEADTLAALWQVLVHRADSTAREPTTAEEVMVIRRFYAQSIFPERFRELIDDYDRSVAGLNEALEKYAESTPDIEDLGLRAAADSARVEAGTIEAVDRFGEEAYGPIADILAIEGRLAAAATTEDSMQILALYADYFEGLREVCAGYEQEVARLRTEHEAIWETDPGSVLDEYDRSIRGLIDAVDRTGSLAEEIRERGGALGTEESLEFFLTFSPKLGRFHRRASNYAADIEDFRENLRYAASPADSNRYVFDIHRKTIAFRDSVAGIAREAQELRDEFFQSIAQGDSARRAERIEQSIELYNQFALSYRSIERAEAREGNDQGGEALSAEIAALYDEAENLARQAIALNPRETVYRTNYCALLSRRAKRLQQRENVHGEAEVWKNWLDVDKSDWERFSVAELHPPPQRSVAEAYGRAAAAWLDVLDEDRGDPDIYFYLAQCKLEMQEYDEAAINYQRSLRMRMALGFLNIETPEEYTQNENRMLDALDRYERYRSLDEIERPFDPSLYATGPVDTAMWALSEFELLFLHWKAADSTGVIEALERMSRFDESHLFRAGISPEQIEQVRDQLIWSNGDLRRWHAFDGIRRAEAAGNYEEAHDLYESLLGSLEPGWARLDVGSRLAILEIVHLDREDDAIERLEGILGDASALDGSGNEELQKTVDAVNEYYGTLCYNQGMDILAESNAEAKAWFGKSSSVPWKDRGCAYAQLAILWKNAPDRCIRFSELAWEERACMANEPRLLQSFCKAWRASYQRKGDIQMAREIHEKCISLEE